MKLSKILLIFLILAAAACKNQSKKKNPDPAQPAIVVRKDTSTLKKEKPPERSPIINITDTILPKITVLYIKDSAASSERISEKLAAIFGSRLNKTIKDNKLIITGPPMAWYKTSKSPFYFEAGFPVNKKPAKTGKNIHVKTVGGIPAVVAHFYGPYSSTYVGYDVLSEWLKDRKKKRSGNPYEIYVTDPLDKEGKPADPYKVQTDIVFPYK